MGWTVRSWHIATGPAKHLELLLPSLYPECGLPGIIGSLCDGPNTNSSVIPYSNHN